MTGDRLPGTPYTGRTIAVKTETAAIEPIITKTHHEHPSPRTRAKRVEDLNQ